MADLWNLILESSTLPDVPEHDLWTHLNNLGAGGVGGVLVLEDGLEVEVDLMEFDVELEAQELDVELEAQELDVEVETTEYEIEVD